MQFAGLDASTVAQRLAASGQPWCWLDGEAAAPGEERVSYLGIASEVREAQWGAERAFLDELRPRGDRAANGRFLSGWVAALSYEFGVALLGLEVPAGSESPGFALRLDAVLAMHHDTGQCVIRGKAGAAKHLASMVMLGDRDSGAEPPERVNEQSRPQWRSSAAEYVDQVEACRAAIHRGDAYVLCLTDTADHELDAADPLQLYEELRRGGSARRGAVIVAGDRALVSASPERFLGVRSGRIDTHPIKGTRPRGTTPDADAELARDLANDPKERAENLMIVDLMRNDLSRVCTVGSVRVERFLEVETHPRVHQLVSEIAGELREGCDITDAVAACFPGGSMTGAPKRSAVSILGGLERGSRGLYSGCFGWLDDSGDAELAMTIRGIELLGLEAGPVRARVGAGGGITADSDALREYAEKELKAEALLAALRSR